MLATALRVLSAVPLLTGGYAALQALWGLIASGAAPTVTFGGGAWLGLFLFVTICLALGAGLGILAHKVSPADLLTRSTVKSR